MSNTHFTFAPFDNYTNAARNTTYASGLATVTYDVGGSAMMTITGATTEVSYNGGAFFNLGASSFSVANGTTVKVRHTSSNSFNTTKTSTVTIGDLTRTLVTTTEAKDTDPDHWALTAPGVELSTLTTSAAHVTTGMNYQALSVTVTNGEVQVNGGSWVTSGIAIYPGDSVKLRGTSSASYGTAVVVTLNMDGVAAATYTITTRAADITPNGFSFTNVALATINTLYTSNSVTMAGMDAGQNSPVTFPTKTNGTVQAPATNAYEVNINGTGWVNATGTLNIQNGQTLQLRMGSSASGSVVASFQVLVNGVGYTWTVTTTIPDTIPDQFTFIDNPNVGKGNVVNSNIIAITGTTSGQNISTSFSTSGTGTGHKFSKNGGAFTSIASPPTVTLGDQIQLQMVAPATATQVGSLVFNTLGTGTVTDQWDVTAQEPDTAPDAFTFTPVTGVDVNTLTTSAAITPVGYNTGSPISIVGGEYQINGGSWTNATGTINPGDTVAARITSDAFLASTVTATVTIGGISGAFDVTTRFPDFNSQYVITFRELNYGRSA